MEACSGLHFKVQDQTCDSTACSPAAALVHQRRPGGLRKWSIWTFYTCWPQLWRCHLRLSSASKSGPACGTDVGTSWQLCNFMSSYVSTRTQIKLPGTTQGSMWKIGLRRRGSVWEPLLTEEVTGLERDVPKAGVKPAPPAPGLHCSVARLEAENSLVRPAGHIMTQSGPAGFTVQFRWPEGLAVFISELKE